LRGLWLTAPYLHDGSAPTLEAIFTSGDSLGLYGGLQSQVESNPRAIEQLVAYLLQIDDSEPAFDLPSPAIEIFSPAPDTSVRAGEPISLAVNIRAFMGPASHVEYYADDLLLGQATGPLYTLPWTPTSPGTTQLTAHLVYENGAATTSAPHRLEVTP
jgi:hypothetical protein